MSLLQTVVLGAIAGFTIFLGLPVARWRNPRRDWQAFLNALATGILVFLLWDVLSKATEPVDRALDQVHRGEVAPFAALAALFLGGVALGLLSLVFVNARLSARLRSFGPRGLEGPGAAVAAEASRLPSSRVLALMIA